MSEDLDGDDEKIFTDVFGSEEPEGFYRFWSYSELQLDGDFTLPQLEKFVEVMKRMAQRRTEKSVP